MFLNNDDIFWLRAHGRILLSLVAIAWFAHLINVATGYSLNWAFKLRPRHPWGLVGIPASPFLHVNWGHLIGNTAVFMPLGWFVLSQGVRLFYVVTIGVTLFSGLLTWLLDDGPSVGASDVIFGYHGFLLIYGYTSGDSAAVIVGVISAVLYGSLISGIFPSQNSTSGWFSHLCGFVGGILLAIWLGDLRHN